MGAVHNLGIDDVMPFGKYKGIEIEEIFEDDPEYMVWATQNEIANFDEEILERAASI